jgi:hypothetical protein
LQNLKDDIFQMQKLAHEHGFTFGGANHPPTPSHPPTDPHLPFSLHGTSQPLLPASLEDIASISASFFRAS